ASAELGAQLLELLEALSAQPERRLAALGLHCATLVPALGSAERHVGPLVPALFEAAARSAGEAPALRSEGRTSSYRQLALAARRVARELLRRGLQPEQVVAVWADRSLENVAALLGVLLAGGVYLPLEPSEPGARLGRMLADSSARLCLWSGAGPAPELA